MPQFTSELDYRDILGEFWIMLAPLKYQSVIKGQTVEIVAERGFPTDLASIPPLVQNLISKTGPWDRPAVIHDKLYSMQFYSKDIADSILLEAMELEGVGKVRRHLIYWAVKYFGDSAWAEHAKNNRIRKAIDNVMTQIQ